MDRLNLQARNMLGLRNQPFNSMQPMTCIERRFITSINVDIWHAQDFSYA